MLGAEFAICPDNTIHQAFAQASVRSPIPWLHIAEAVAEEAAARGFRRLAVLGTKYLMTGPVYPDVLERQGIECRIPEEAERKRIDAIIFKELVNGIFLEYSRRYFNSVIKKLKDQGCDAVVLGCTEIPLLVVPAIPAAGPRFHPAAGPRGPALLFKVDGGWKVNPNILLCKSQWSGLDSGHFQECEEMKCEL